MNKALVPALVGLLALTMAAAEPAAPQQDYSKGFEKLFALGLPDISTAKCVTINARGINQGDGSYWQYELKTKGTGWLLSESTNGPSLAVIGQAMVLPVWKSDVLERIRRSETKSRPAATSPRRFSPYETAPQDGRMGADWIAANYTNDLALILKRLDPPKPQKKPKPEEEEESEVARSNFSGDLDNIKQAYGPIFLMAAQAWKRGFTNEANRIASRLFTLAGDPRQVILAAYNSLADQQYSQAYNVFLGDRKWQAFAGSLDTLLQRFPQGWKNRPGVQMLASNVTARLAGPAPEIKGDGLTDEDRAIAAELAAMTEIDPEDRNAQYRSYSVWLLSKPSTNAARTAVQKIQRRGVKALPLLVALMDDPYMLPIDRATYGGQSYSMSFISEVGGEEQDARALDMIQHPITRGELARQLLMPVLITGDKSSYEVQRRSQDELRSVAADMVQKLLGKSPIKLARVYFKEGTQEQRTAAVMVLLRSSEASDIKLVEDMLADPTQIQDNLSLLSTYVTVRGPAAGTLIRALAAEVGVSTNAPATKTAAKKTDDSGDGDNAEAEQESNQENDYVKRHIKELLALVSDRKLDSMLADIAAGRDDSTQASLLFRQLSQGDLQTSLDTLLTAVLKATNAESRVKLLAYGRYLRASGGAIGGFYDSEQELPQRGTLDLAKSKEPWLALLKDDRFVPRGSPPATVAEIAAEVIESLYGKQETDSVQTSEGTEGDEVQLEGAEGSEMDASWAQMGQYAAYYSRSPSASMLSYSTGRRGREFVLARARKRLAGEDVPPYPSGRVSQERRKAVLKQLEDGPAQAVAALTLEDLLWLGPALNTKSNLNVRLAPLSLRISGFTVPPGDDAAATLAAKWKDGALGRPLVDDLLAYTREKLAAGAPVIVSLYRQPGFDGTLVYVEPMASMARSTLSSYSYYMRDAPPDKAVVLATMDATSVHWVLDAAAPAVESAPAAGQSEIDALLAEALSDARRAIAKSGDKQRERFWKAIDALAQTNPSAARSIVLMGIKPGTFSKKDLQQYGGQVVF